MIEGQADTVGSGITVLRAACSVGGFTISIASKYDLYRVVLQLGGHLILRLAVLVLGEHLVILHSAGCNRSVVSASNIPEPLLG